MSQPDCRYVGTDLRRIREYLRGKHGWDLELKGGYYLTNTAEEERRNSL
jgi:hypothetical protein